MLVSLAYLITYLFALYIIFLSFKNPIYALAFFIYLNLIEYVLSDYLNLPANLNQISGIFLILVFTLNKIINFKKYPVRFDKIHFFLFLFICYISVSDFKSAIGTYELLGRNWIFTYFQLLLITIITSSLTNSKSNLTIIIKFLFISTILLSIVRMILYAGGSLNFETASEISSENTLGRFYVVSMLYALYGLFHSKKLHNNILYSLTLLFLLSQLFLTDSRTMIFILLVLGIVILTKNFNYNIWYSTILTFFTLVLFFIFGGQVFSNLIDSFSGALYAEKGGTGQLGAIQNNIRLFLLAYGIQMLFDNSLLFGIGTGNFKYYIVDYFPLINQPMGSHNTYVSVLAENGLIGFIIFLSIIYCAIKNINLQYQISYQGLLKTKAQNLLNYGIFINMLLLRF